MEFFLRQCWTRGIRSGVGYAGEICPSDQLDLCGRDRRGLLKCRGTPDVVLQRLRGSELPRCIGNYRCAVRERRCIGDAVDPKADCRQSRRGGASLARDPRAVKYLHKYLCGGDGWGCRRDGRRDGRRGMPGLGDRRRRRFRCFRPRCRPRCRRVPGCLRGRCVRAWQSAGGAWQSAGGMVHQGQDDASDHDYDSESNDNLERARSVVASVLGGSKAKV